MVCVHHVCCARVPLCGLLCIPLCVGFLLFQPPTALFRLRCTLGLLYSLADACLRISASIPRAVGLPPSRMGVGGFLVTQGRTGAHFVSRGVSSPRSP